MSPDVEDGMGEMAPSATGESSLLLIEDAEDCDDEGFNGEGFAGTYDVLLVDSGNRFSACDPLELLLCCRDSALVRGISGFEDVERNSEELRSAPRLDEFLPA